jgi:hypothetical protein
MLVFGLGTIPAILLLILGGSAAGPFFRFRRGAAIFLAAAGLLLVLRGLAGWGLVPHSSFW